MELFICVRMFTGEIVGQDTITPMQAHLRNKRLIANGSHDRWVQSLVELGAHEDVYRQVNYAAKKA